MEEQRNGLRRFRHVDAPGEISPPPAAFTNDTEGFVRTGRTLLTIVALTAATAAGAEVTTWNVDRSHSWVGFSVKHMMVTNVRGEFGAFKGTVTTEGDDPATAKIDVSIEAASIDTRDAKRDEHLRSADFFDAANQPTIRFVSTAVEKAGSGLKVKGDLTMRGVTKPVVLDVTEVTPAVADGWGGRRVGVQATTKLNRKEFGVSWNKTLDAGGVVVGDEVTVTLELELVNKPAAAAR
jgi:polyisoprenoid-binding protein YceI